MRVIFLTLLFLSVLHNLLLLNATKSANFAKTDITCWKDQVNNFTDSSGKPYSSVGKKM